MGIWHTNYDAKEIFRSRQEDWNDRDPRVTVELHVAQDDLYAMTNYMIAERTAWPYNDISPYELNVDTINIRPIQTKYVADRGVDESLTTGETRIIRVEYKPNTAFEHTIVTDIGTGTATDYGYEFQTVWVDVKRIVETEFLTQDFQDFQWDDGTPIKPDEAPGKVFRTVKYDVKYRNVFLTQDLEWIIYYFNDTVNDSDLTAAYNLITFNQDQVKFNVEDVEPSLKYDRSTLGETPMPDSQILHNLRCSFHVRLGESTWNKFWRARQDPSGVIDDSDWYTLQYKKGAVGQPTAVDHQPFERTTRWYPLWPT